MANIIYVVVNVVASHQYILKDELSKTKRPVLTKPSSAAIEGRLQLEEK
jgi:hypothetical protein